MASGFCKNTMASQRSFAIMAIQQVSACNIRFVNASYFCGNFSDHVRDCLQLKQHKVLQILLHGQEAQLDFAASLSIDHIY
jgi:hypothetical protein